MNGEWTRTPPKEPGFYWFRRDPPHDDGMQVVEQGGGVDRAPWTVSGYDGCITDDEMDGVFWNQKIEPPA